MKTSGYNNSQAKSKESKRRVKGYKILKSAGHFPEGVRAIKEKKKLILVKTKMVVKEELLKDIDEREDDCL